MCNLSSFSCFRLHIVELGLEDPNTKNESLGYLRLGLKISPVIVGDQEGTTGSIEQPSKEEKKQKSRASNVWTSVLTVTLLEGHNLPAMDQNGKIYPTIKWNPPTCMVEVSGVVLITQLDHVKGYRKGEGNWVIWCI